MLIIDEIRAMSRLQKAISVSGVSVAALGGAVVGYKIALNKLGETLRQEADEAVQKEIQETREFLEQRATPPAKPFQTPEEAVAALHPTNPDVRRATEALVQYAGNRKLVENFLERPLSESIRADEDNGLVEIAENVFTDHAVELSGWDYDAELEARDPDFPYVISDEEFNGDEFGYEQVQYTYYAGDGTLADVREEVVEEVGKVVGVDNLHKFGHGSNDENIVYIRNVPLMMEIEIALSPGKYAKAVLGFDDEEITLSHSSDSRPRKFRNHHD